MIAELFTRAFQRAATTIDPVHPRDPALAKMFGLGNKTTSGVSVDEVKILGYPAVFRGLNLLSNVHFRSRPRIFERTTDGRREGKRRATEHPSYPYVTRRANRIPYISAAMLRSTLHWWALAWGNGMAAIQRDRNGDILGIAPMLPDRSWVVKARGGEFKIDDGRNNEPGEMLYATRIGNDMVTMSPDDVVHIKGLTWNGIVGVPVVEILAESLGLGMAVREFGSRFFGGGAVPSGIIEMPGHLEEEQAQVFQDSLKKAHQGLGKSHMIMLLEDGLKFHQTTIPPEHAQFLQTREFEVREVANIIGVQPHKLGDPSRKSFNSLEQSNQEHLDDDLDPWLGRFEEELAEKTLTEQEKINDSHFVEFNRNALVKTHAESRTAMYAAGRQWGWLSANDIRSLENMNAIGPEGDVYLSPGNMLPADQLGQDQERLERAAQELRKDYLNRTMRRLEKQALAKAKTGNLEKWIATLRAPADAPVSVYADCERMHRCVADALSNLKPFDRPGIETEVTLAMEGIENVNGAASA